MTKFNTKLFPALFLLLSVALTFTACDGNGSDPDPDDLNITEIIAVEGELSALNQALADTDLGNTLSDEGPATLFAPVNDALPDTLSGEELTEALKYHIVEMNLTYDNLQDIESVVTLSGDSLFFSAENDTVTINDAQAVITSDGMEASNGTVFVIDTLLTPIEE